MQTPSAGRIRVVINGRFLEQPLTGVQRYARELLATLDARAADLPNLDITVLAPRDAPAPDLAHLRLVRDGRFSGHLWEQVDLPRLARGADVVFCPGNTAPLALLLAGRTASVVTVHDLAFRDAPETVSRAFRLSYEALIPVVMRRATRVITVSEAERTRILRDFPGAADRLRAVANGGLPRTPPVPGPEDPQPPEGRFVLYVGAFNSRKNIAGVVHAARAAMATRPGLRTVLIGGGAGIYSEVDLGPMDDRFVLPGRVSDAALVEHYRAAAALVFPSFHEASGLPPVEAMANGCPVVVSDIPALRERCGDAAVYCDPHDPDSITAALERVLEDPELAERLSAQGRERAAEFTWDNCLDRTLAIIREAAGSRPRG